MFHRWFPLALAIVVATWFSVGWAAEKTIIRHGGFEDFRKGSFPDGGTTIYVSKAGRIQLIPRWDFNDDGYLDVLIGQDHDHVEKPDALIYWGNKSGYESLFPPLWRDMPASKLLEELVQRRQRVAMLPTDGGGPTRIADFNCDGYPDIVLVNTIHNYSVDMKATVYWGGLEGYSIRRRTELPTLFGRDVAVADFNRDGYPDLVVANFGNEIGDRWGYKNHLESYIYWGSPEGFVLERRTSIPTVSAVSCCAGDFNGDGWPDLAFVNNNLKQRSVYVYLGGKDGFAPERRLVFEGGNPGVVRAGDVNSDEFDDLIVSSGDKGTAIYYGARDFSFAKAAVQLPTQIVRDVALADFNRDGHMDLVFASRASRDINAEIKEGAVGFFDSASKAATVKDTLSEVYFGSASGFDPTRRLLLPTLSPQAVAAADLNGDGYPDIIFANSRGVDVHGVDCHDVPSYVYWGGPDGFDASRRTDLQGFGPAGVAVGDLNKDGLPDIVLTNQISGATICTIPSIIFWGNPAHSYSEANVTRLPTRGVYYYTTADFNDDGYVDLLFSGKTGPSLYWGSPQGFTEPQVFGGIDVRGMTVRDFNRDGYLDICFSVCLPDPREKSYGLMVWGGPNGFSLQNSTKIPLQTYRSVSVASADLNKDGYQDLVIACEETPTKQSQILCGGPNGFDPTRSTLLKTDDVGAPAIADLNGDGWLDMVFPGTMKLDTQDCRAESLIYWGSEQGFSDDRRTGALEAFGGAEIAVADLNRDGFLDIVQTNYKANNTRSLPAYIFWGTADHKYSNQRRTELPAESACGVQVLDLNQDSYPDIVVHNHIKDGDHCFGSYIYWGSESGYSVDRRTSLPTRGPHFAMNMTPGNIYDRGPGHAYHSPPLQAPPGKTQLELDFDGETPHHTAIQFQVRFAAEESGLQTSKWLPIGRRESVSIPSGTRFMQYSAVLISPDGANSPVLREVVLSF